jgi:hypothetical protein
MKSATLPILTATAPSVGRTPELQLNPFLHVGADRVYNPLTDRTLAAGEPGYDTLRGLLSGALALAAGPVHTRLAAEGWLLPGDAEPAREFRLKYV